MHILETDDWSLLLPPEWWAEQEEESVLIGDSDDVGCIEISQLRHPDGRFDLAAVREIAEDEGAWKTCQVAGLAGICSESDEDGAALREWYLFRGAVLLYVTYSCDAENRGMDDSAVDDILGTLTLDPDITD